jgi:pteridine reductase
LAGEIIELQGKTALVTGAAKRLGRATALRLAESGCNIVLHYRGSRSEAEATAKNIQEFGVNVWLLQADLELAEEVERAWREASGHAGAIDFLINSASIFDEEKLADLDEENLLRNLRINTLAPFRLCQLFQEQQREGAIVNFLDTRYLDYDRNHVPYHLSKRMLFSLTRMMAEEYAPRIRVNAVAPGLVLAPEGKSQDYLEKLKHTNPLQRYGSEAGVAEAVWFLVRSGFITGQVIFVDGGRHMRGAFYG